MAKVDPQVEAIIRVVTEVAEKVVKKVTLDCAANLVDATPVDTGWARANWVPSVGSSYDIDVSSQSGVDRGNYVSQAEATRLQGQSEVLAYKLSKGDVFISNNVPYMESLNNGTSRQAPRGFVQAAIEKAVTQDILTL